MEKQTTTTAAACISMAEAMQTATISDQTRRYLILIGKLNDLYEEGYKIVREDVSDVHIDECLKDYSCGVCAAISNIEKLLNDRICATYNSKEFYTKRQI